MSLDQDSSAPLRDLNAAFLGNPVRILVPDGLHIEQPIELLWITQPTELTSGRVEIVIGQQSSLTVVERHEGSGATLSNTLMVAHCQEGSAFRYFKLQMESMEAVHLAQQHVRAERASHIELFHLDRGAQLSRNDLRVSLAGAESNLNARGLFTVSGSQHSDNHVRIDHLAERTTSHAVYRGIADGNARAVFSGKILVQSGASGANARLGNQNLLLTPNAEIDSTPALEIYADDVKCSHGSTTGQLDQAALFYLRSRGIAEQEARQMLVEAFAAEIITQLPEHPLRDPLLALLRSGARAGFVAGGMQ
jgi:Fe-S cluster assembly protein SufD